MDADDSAGSQGRHVRDAQGIKAEFGGQSGATRERAVFDSTDPNAARGDSGRAEMDGTLLVVVFSACVSLALATLFVIVRGL
jgi:hypothetical protein